MPPYGDLSGKFQYLYQVKCKTMDIRNIIFDFGGVLLDWNPRYLYREIFDDDERMEYFLAHICTTEWNAEQDAGRTWAEAVAVLQAQHPEYADLIRLYADGWPKMLNGEFPESVALLHRLKAAGYAVYGLTNWSAETFPVALERFGFLQELDGIVVSGEEKVMKPDERIYRILLDRYGLKADESVFIDDNAPNVAAAERLGIHGILFDNADNVAAHLRKSGVRV